MIVLLSPAKTLDETPIAGVAHSQPRHQTQSRKLVRELKKKSVGDLQELMGISENLAELNRQRFRSFRLTTTPEHAKQAALMFKGDVYLGLEAHAFDEAELAFAQESLRMLSGLYGLLRPLDRIQPYRLEMGTRLANGDYKDLYQFWGNRITRTVNADLAETGSDVVINLASQEYFRSVQASKLKARLITVHFKEDRDGQLKVISFNAKKARGRMAHLIVKERIEVAEELKSLVVNDYCFRGDLSSETDWVFVK